MKVLDPGHDYILDSLDGAAPQRLTFVKRDSQSHPDGHYPGNVGSHAGTNIQEVLRALIERMKYLDNQIPCHENKVILGELRHSLYLLEQRAAARHGESFLRMTLDGIEHEAVCEVCGHIQCSKHKEAGE